MSSQNWYTNLDCQYGQPICSLSPIVPCCRRFTQPHLHCHL
ncbi:hypothetical protein HanXRQr2_Chr07g0308101 [Helianthus annuus]|uniref:Uncharacterized protein n=1 Tax=Helianthus annuus TaxID=4232 RepID=A0A9K3NHJ5_HELAN|nr:hypothetical protein HanXRQr2_Chr07g0308101 [Helianthus annuus]